MRRHSRQGEKSETDSSQWSIPHGTEVIHYMDGLEREVMAKQRLENIPRKHQTMNLFSWLPQSIWAAREGSSSQVAAQYLEIEVH